MLNILNQRTKIIKRVLELVEKKEGLTQLSKQPHPQGRWGETRRQKAGPTKTQEACTHSLQSNNTWFDLMVANLIFFSRYCLLSLEAFNLGKAKYLQYKLESIDGEYYKY